MRIVVALVLGLTLSACAYRERPIYNPENIMPLYAQDLPPDRIEALIVAGGSVRGWTFQHVGEGHLQATLTHPKYQAVVDVVFDTKSWRIVHNRTLGLRDQDGHIHDHYNLLIHNLEHDITAKLVSVTK